MCPDLTSCSMGRARNPQETKGEVRRRKVVDAYANAKAEYTRAGP
jgi:hypothetical protein